MLRKILPHAAIVISVMYFIFFVIDKVNEPMAFVNNGITKALLLVMCVITVVNSVLLIREDREKERRRQRRLKKKKAARRAAR